jgi:hypothetical protein
LRDPDTLEVEERFAFAALQLGETAHAGTVRRAGSQNALRRTGNAEKEDLKNNQIRDKISQKYV